MSSNARPSIRNSDRSWGPVAKALHWSIALLIVALMVPGRGAVNYPVSPTKIKLFMWHKSIGITMLVLHIGAALRHHYICRDDILSHMLPFKRPN